MITPDEHGEHHRSKNWQRYHDSDKLSPEAKHHIAAVTVMTESAAGQLQRGHVRTSFDICPEQGVVASIMWGYPKGKFPGGREFEPIFSHLPQIAAAVVELKKTSGLTADRACKTIKCVSGMGPSTYTKILHFAGVHCCEGACLIYDQMVMRSISQSTDPLWAGVASALGVRHPGSRAPFPLEKHISTYGAYLAAAQAVAAAQGVTPEQVELDMFNLAPRGRLAKT